MSLRTLLFFVICATAIQIRNRHDRRTPKRMIIDTDMLDFVDDPVGVFSRYVLPALDAINTYYGHGDIPLAIQKPIDNSTRNPTYPQPNEYITGLASSFPQDIHNGSNASDPISLYRTLLSQSPDHSITIAAIGFLDNIYNLLHSPGDSISPLSGSHLVRKKVAELVVQGNPTGPSFNFVEHDIKFAAYVLTHWPGIVTFVPDAIGSTVFFGARLTTQLDVTRNPVAYTVATSIGVNVSHESWDSTAIYYAIRGLGDVYVSERSRGEIYFFGNGSADWNFTAPSRRQRSVELRLDNATFASRLEDLILSYP
ncbi:hypothetical protein T440DRAFT_516385 [Plenodomus tracheiphilus IPT5]|uniref:Inosine/uridine-preferring nucleoside hydrolase domain-containing protein n=1 Tax=Plenodomus tracheiphilus IPT5 TaxID=1408161 RepID=A0A6A7BBA2_9PLEO|nr:hypothetical protein T440DRAFT_516385 [Plenodomus tracheiphilus IPT5]